MRSLALAAAALLLLPMVGAIPAAPLPRAPAALVPALPDDLSDGDLLRMIARLDGIEIGPTPPVVIPDGLTLPLMVQQMGARANVPVSVEEAAIFATLDPRVSVPVLQLLVAMDESWTMIEKANSRLTREDVLYILEAEREMRLDDPRLHELSAMVDKRMLLEAAILVLDTAEGVVIPALQEAVRQGAWPANAVADPGLPGNGGGVLRLGGTGTDKERVNRILQIDPSGNDYYYNNAGGSTFLTDVDAETMDSPIGLSFDFAGDDLYRYNATAAQGGASLGFGFLYDGGGDDSYRAVINSQGGASATGTGLLRDVMGNDTYYSGSFSGGAASGRGILRDDVGHDSYAFLIIGGGASSSDNGTGLLWDRAGTDRYNLISSGAWEVYGWSFMGGRGWFVDEGTGVDIYQQHITHPHGCNDCTWKLGTGTTLFPDRNGRGNDNRGGLAALAAEDNAFPSMPELG